MARPKIVDPPKQSDLTQSCAVGLYQRGPFQWVCRRLDLLGDTVVDISDTEPDTFTAARAHAIRILGESIR